MFTRSSRLLEMKASQIHIFGNRKIVKHHLWYTRYVVLKAIHYILYTSYLTWDFVDFSFP